MFSLEMIRPHEENDLDQSLQNLIQQILTLDDNQVQLDSLAVNWCPKQHSRGTVNESGFRGVSLNGNAGWQVLCMVDGRQQFIATVGNRTLGAILHDIVQM